MKSFVSTPFNHHTHTCQVDLSPQGHTHCNDGSWYTPIVMHIASLDLTESPQTCTQ